MKSLRADNQDLIEDMALQDLYADEQAIVITIDDWGNEWEDSNQTGTDYWIVED